MSACAKGLIMVVAGGSGGHIFPAVAFCEEMKELRPDGGDVVFITSARGASIKFIPQEFNPLFLKTSKNLFDLLRLCFLAFFLMRQMKPRFVFGFGGYMTIPFLLGAKIL